MFISFQSLLFAQNPTEEFPSRSDCDNFNAFVDDESTLTTIREYASDISPTGIIRLDPSKAHLYSGIEGILSFMNLDEDTDFELVRSTPSRFQGGGVYTRYQQFYKGVEVEGGGFTEYNDNPGGGTYNPCGTTTMIAMSIQTGMNIDAVPNVPIENLESIIQNDGNDPEISIAGSNPPKLVISSNLLDGCTYNLVWKVEYFHEGSNIVWIDAQLGIVLKSVQLENDNSISKVAIEYESHNFSNADESIFACSGLVLHDMSGSCSEFTTIQDVTSAPIIEPNTITSEIEDRFCCAIDVYNDLLPDGVEMAAIHLGINCAFDNAFSLPGSTITNPVLVFNNGYLEGIDIIGHEIGHTFINQFFTTATRALEIRSIHEGVSDMLGVFVESQCNNQEIDWSPNNIDATPPEFVRNLADPKFPCITSNTDNEHHSFGETLGHWFQLVVDGSVEDNIPNIGLETTLNIVLDALSFLDGTATFDKFTDAVKNVVLAQFGPGSDEAHAIWDAFALTCFSDETWLDKFHVNLHGTNISACEEGEDGDGDEPNNAKGPRGIISMNASINGDDPTTRFHWDLPSRWVNTGATSSSLRVASFPEYPYYPQYFKICVSVSSYPHGSTGSKTCFQVMLKDCDGNDQTCEDYYNIEHRKSNDSNKISSPDILDDYPNLKVYNFIGQLLFDGNPNMFQNESNNFDRQIILMVYFDEKGLFK